jgi:cytochrome c biogenesis protein CcmG, thiol:disulfide interchange protein DsbE
MNFKTLSTPLLALALLGASFGLSAQDRLPAVQLQDIHGAKVDLGQYADNGKITVINFWATWCTPCKKELNNIAGMYPDWQKDYNVELVAISIDDARNKAKVKSYVDGQQWDYEVLIDVNGLLKQKLNFQQIPFTVVVDQKGNIVSRHAGYVDGDEYLLEEELAKLAGK